MAPGTTVANAAELQLDGNLAIGNEALTYTGLGFQNRTSLPSLFVGAVHEISGDSTWGTGLTPIQNAGGNNQVNYLGADSGTSLVLNGQIFQPTGLPGGQFTHINKVGTGTIEFQGSTPNLYGTTAVFDGTLVLNKSPGISATGFAFTTAGAVIVGDNSGAADGDKLVLAARRAIPDAAAITVAGTGQVSATRLRPRR